MRGSTLTCGVIHLSDPRSVDDQKDNIVVTFYKDFILIILFIGRGSVKSERRLWKYIEEKNGRRNWIQGILGCQNPPALYSPPVIINSQTCPCYRYRHTIIGLPSLPRCLTASKIRIAYFTALSCLPDRFYCKPGNPYIITQCIFLQLGQTSFFQCPMTNYHGLPLKDSIKRRFDKWPSAKLTTDIANPVELMLSNALSGFLL